MSCTHGPAYDPVIDGAPLRRQHEVIRDYMLVHTHEWLTLAEISASTNFPEASVSAQLRHLRKQRFGSYLVAGGSCSWEYQVLPPIPKGQGELFC